jgi:outer membrane protein assembly factor BamB
MTEHKKINITLWRNIAYIAGAFSFIIGVLIIANYLQISQVDPVDSKVLNVLIERLNENPEDAELREQVREFDLLARKAYFTNAWQIKTGGYLLAIGLIVVLIALQMIEAGKKKIQLKNNLKDEKYHITQKKARRWIAIGGSFFAVIAILFAFLTHQEFSQKFTTEKPVELAENMVPESTLEAEPIEIEAVVEDTVQEVPKDTVLLAELKEEPAVEKDSSSVKVKEVEEPVKEEAAPAISMTYPTAAMKKNYPSFRGPGGNGIAYQTNIPTDWDGASGKNILWKVKIPIHGYNSPVIWGNKLFLSGADGKQQQVYCYNRLTGDLLWTADANNIKGSPATKPKVTDDTGHAAASVCCDGQAVYAIFSTGDIIAFDMNGKELWSKNLGSTGNHYGHSSSLYVVNQKLIVQYDTKKNPKIMALSTQTGETVWSENRKVKISWASPIVVNTGKRIEVMLLADPTASSYDSETGEKLWEIDCTYGEVGPSLAYSNGRVFALNEYAKLVGIGINNPDKSAKILWEDDELLSDVPSPIATKDFLFIATSYGDVACYNAKTGDNYWIEEFGTSIYSSPILVDGKVYLIDRDGVMHIFKLGETFELIGRPKLGVKSDCTPAFANGRIYIRADKHLYCIGEK